MQHTASVQRIKWEQIIASLKQATYSRFWETYPEMQKTQASNRPRQGAQNFPPQGQAVCFQLRTANP